MRNTIELSIVIPVYHAVSCIGDLADRLREVLSCYTPNYELILVNDASPDSSWEVIKKLRQEDKRIKGINLAENIGQLSAISVGLIHAQGQWIAVMDCDLQDLPEEFSKLWEKSQQGFDIVMARRTQRKDTIMRQITSWCFHQLLSLKSGMKTDPAIANYAIYDKKVIDQYRQDYFHHGSPFSVLNYVKNFSFASVDTIDGVSARGKSSYSLSKKISLAFSLLFPKGIMETRHLQFKARHLYLDGIERYGVRLHPLTVHYIERVRNWRNSPEIATYMNYREHITPEQQQEWFTSIDNEYNNYSLVEYRGEYIGMTNIKNIDYNDRTAESGLFIIPKYQNTDIPFRVSLYGLDYNFGVLRLEQVTAHILSNNKRAIRFNQALGFRLLSGQEEIENQLYRLTKKDYYEHRALLLDLLGEYS